MAQDGNRVAGGEARVPRLLFASYHCYLDPSSGAGEFVWKTKAQVSTDGDTVRWQEGVNGNRRMEYVTWPPFP